MQEGDFSRLLKPMAMLSQDLVGAGETGGHGFNGLS
jgi:hypothetical protein